MPSYGLYGLRLESNVPLRGLMPVDPGDPSAEVEVHFGSLPPALPAAATAPWYESEARDAEVPALRVHRLPSTGDLWLRYADGTEFLIEAAARSVWAAWPSRFTIDDAMIYLLGPVLGILLRLRRITSLHASVVEVDGRALGFAGPGGAGKSSIAAAFASAGHRVLSDDMLVLDERPDGLWAEPGYPWLRLWPPAVEGLYGSPEALPRLAEGWDKRYADLEADGAFLGRSIPLGAIYLIGDRAPRGRGPKVEPVARPTALKRLIVDSYTARLPGPSARREEFRALARLVSSVPVRRLVPTDGWSSVASLRATVLDDYAKLADARVA